MNLYLQIWFYGMPIILCMYSFAYIRARWRNYYKLPINQLDEAFRVDAVVSGKKVIIIKQGSRTAELLPIICVAFLWPLVITVVGVWAGIEKLDVEKWKKKLRFSIIKGGCHFICTNIFASKKEKEQVKQIRASRALGVEPK